MISWKLEITENETRLVIQDGIVMSSDVLSLARHLVNKYHLSTLSIYDKNNEKLRPIPDALQDDWNTGTVCDQILGSPF